MSKIHFYIKHAIGSRMLFDVSGEQKSFSLDGKEGEWIFTVEDVEPEAAALVENNKWNLNLFYFIEEPGKPIRKYWYYDKDKPQIDYDLDSRRWTIQVDTRMEYNNEKI
ncbi:hypothetical protein [Paenibacillus sp. OAS669]|uniref:hypothetical protein n=1 Tax=Paenibacillus sp. OAS669 TaxID=2663821 RepID=UPI001789E0E2|nr:hypothetical protein [Paenibacillus sp. OAS669]MBE1443146.1 hypothetical protein [Paenibacillus sp. OAS669]